jgi:hypothetical protein
MSRETTGFENIKYRLMINNIESISDVKVEEHSDSCPHLSELG